MRNIFPSMYLRSKITGSRKMEKDLKSKNDPSKPMVYQIKIKGHLGHQWSGWFNGPTNGFAGIHESSLDYFLPFWYFSCHQNTIKHEFSNRITIQNKHKYILATMCFVRKM